MEGPLLPAGHPSDLRRGGAIPPRSGAKEEKNPPGLTEVASGDRWKSRLRSFYCIATFGGADK